MRAVLLCVILVGLCTGVVRGAEMMVADGGFLQPTTTVEVRFERAMVGADDVGISVTGEASPVVVEPALEGAFTWLSTRSGVFVPGEVPAMATGYRFATRPGLAAADGTAVAATEAVLSTPAFGVTSVSVRGGPRAQVWVAYNREVELGSFEGKVRFVNTDGRRLAAQVGRPEKWSWLEEEAEDWEWRWGAVHGRERSAEAPQGNRVQVLPVGLLEPGGTWSVEIDAGVLAVNGAATADAWVRGLEPVEPFTVDQVTVSNVLNGGRKVSLRFSEEMGPDVTEKTAGRFVSVEPAVEGGLRFEESWRTLVVRGAFELGVPYKLVLSPNLLSADGLAVSGELEREVEFDPVMPRVYLPAITGHQIRGGRRELPVVSVNVESLRVVARRVAAGSVVPAVEAFRDYHKKWDEKLPDEDYQALPAGAIRGELLFDEVVPVADGAPGVDLRQTTVLDWDEIVGGDDAAGTVFLTVEGTPAAAVGGQRIGAQALLQLTDFGVLWKKYGERLWVTVFSMASGEPEGGVSVALLDEERGELAKGETGADGGVWIDLGGGEPNWLVVQRGDDVHAMRMGSGARALPTAAFGLPMRWVNWRPDDVSLPAVRSTIFTDRPLYRPGETVRVKGLVRGMGEQGLEAFAEKSGELRLTLPNDRGQKLIEVKTDARGSFDAAFEIDPVVTGRYGLRLNIDGVDLAWQGRSAGFVAAEFQPNAFEVEVDAPARSLAGDPYTAAVSGRYFFGAATAGARVQWTVQGGASWFGGNGWWEFVFGDGWSPEDRRVTLRGEGELAADGTLALEPELPDVPGFPWRGVLTVEVTDENQQTVSATQPVVRNASSFYLGIADGGHGVVAAGEAYEVRAVAVDAVSKKPVDEVVEVQAELVRREFETVRVRGAGNAISFQTEEREEVVAAASGLAVAPVWNGDLWALPDGSEASAVFTPEVPGSYEVRVRAKDAGGRETVASMRFEVGAADGVVAWDFRHPSQVTLQPDKREYVAGETARILAKTPFGGEALVTIERGTQLLRSTRVSLEGNAPMIEVPLEAGDGPNVFVSMVLLRGADDSTRKYPVPEFRYGMCQLRVVDPATRLGVRVFPRRGTVEPGDEVEVEVQVRDGLGRGVEGAEVTLFAVDDGILELAGYVRPEPWARMHAPVPLEVATGLTLFQLLKEDPAALDYGNKGYLIGGGGLGGPGTKLRKNFPGTAAWLPSLTTGPGGRLVATLTAPDALTRYRLVAVANSGAGGFGSGESSFQIRKRLMLLSGLGQSGHRGDELLARAVVRNESGAAGTVKVGLKLDPHGEAAGDGVMMTEVELGDGESAAVDFPVRLLGTGEARWEWAAEMGEGKAKIGDRVEARLRVGSPAPLLRETYLTELGGEENDLLAGVNPQLLEGEGSVWVTVSNTRLAGLRGASDGLLTYPYGCAEQTISAMVPWIIVRKLGPVLPDVGATEAEVQGAIDLGVAKVLALQVESGGIGYWPGARRASLFASAWAGVALALIEHAGETVPDDPADRLYDYLRGALEGAGRGGAQPRLDDRVLAAFALAAAGRGEAGYHEVLYRRRASMSHETRALLALAVLASEGSGGVVDDLLDDSKQAPPGTSWFGGASRERAVRLMAVVQRRANDPEVGRLVAELLQGRSGATGAWRTTQENAWALLALADYFSGVEGGEVSPVAGAVVVGEERDGRTAFSLTREVLTESVWVTFDKVDPLGRLGVDNPAKGRLYGEARFEVLPPVADQPAQDRGYAVSRAYQKLGPDGTPGPAENLQVGDRILVTLRVRTERAGHFVAIDDPLPAVLEAVNPNFKSAAVGGGAGMERSWASDYREVRADRVVYFCDHLAAGSYVFRYLARVRAAGTVSAPATKVEEMYRPERFGLGASGTLTAKGL